MCKKATKFDKYYQNFALGLRGVVVFEVRRNLEPPPHFPTRLPEVFGHGSDLFGTCIAAKQRKNEVEPARLRCAILQTPKNAQKRTKNADRHYHFFVAALTVNTLH